MYVILREAKSLPGHIRVLQEAYLQGCGGVHWQGPVRPSLPPPRLPSPRNEEGIRVAVCLSEVVHIHIQVIGHALEHLLMEGPLRWSA